MGGKNLRTLVELGSRGAWLEVTCLRCQHVAVLSVFQLSKRIGGLDADPQRLKFKCTECGSKRFRWSPAFVGDGRKRPPTK